MFSGSESQRGGFRLFMISKSLVGALDYCLCFVFVCFSHSTAVVRRRCGRNSVELSERAHLPAVEREEAAIAITTASNKHQN
jgi:hypothetical protein